MSFVIGPILNIYPLFLINIFYENQTGLGYIYRHLFLFLSWAFVTSCLTYVYSKIIWEHYNISYKKKLHALFHVGMFFACCIPYIEAGSILNDLHIWISIVCICGYITEWATLLFHPLFITDSTFNKRLLGILLIFIISAFPFFAYGSVISLGELLYSILQPIYFYSWISSMEAAKSEKCI